MTTLIDPDYGRIYTKLHCLARSYGFACVLHGSGARDLDLLLVPWEKHAANATVDQDPAHAGQQREPALPRWQR